MCQPRLYLLHISHIWFFTKGRRPISGQNACTDTIITRYCGLVKGRFQKCAFFARLQSYKKNSFFCIFCPVYENLYLLCSIFNHFFVDFAENCLRVSPHPTHRCPHNILWSCFVVILLQNLPLLPEKHSPSIVFHSLYGLNRPRQRPAGFQTGKNTGKIGIFRPFILSIRAKPCYNDTKSNCLHTFAAGKHLRTGVHWADAASPLLFFCFFPGANHYIFIISDRGGYPHEKENF